MDWNSLNENKMVAYISVEDYQMNTLFLPIRAVNDIQLFHSLKFQEVPVIQKKFVSENAIFKLSWQPGHLYVKSLRPTRNRGKAEKPATDFASFTRSAKCIFSKRWSSLSLMPSFWSLKNDWIKIIWLTSSHNPEWWLKGLSEAIWKKSLVRNDIMKTWPGCSILFKCRILSFFWDYK